MGLTVSTADPGYESVPAEPSGRSSFPSSSSSPGRSGSEGKRWGSEESGRGGTQHGPDEPPSVFGRSSDPGRRQSEFRLPPPRPTVVEAQPSSNFDWFWKLTSPKQAAGWISHSGAEPGYQAFSAEDGGRYAAPSPSTGGPQLEKVQERRSSLFPDRSYKEEVTDGYCLLDGEMGIDSLRPAEASLFEWRWPWTRQEENTELLQEALLPGEPLHEDAEPLVAPSESLLGSGWSSQKKVKEDVYTSMDDADESSFLTGSGARSPGLRQRNQASKLQTVEDWLS